jgi:hypothetical protein
MMVLIRSFFKRKSPLHDPEREKYLKNLYLCRDNQRQKKEN